MPKQVMFALMIEFCMIIVTALCLLQPKPFFEKSEPASRDIATYTGYLFLCLTFCWSFILGSILTLSRVSVWMG